MLKTARNYTDFKGQSLVEYGLAISLIAVVCIGGLIVLGNSLGGVLTGMKTTMEGGQAASSSPAGANTPSISSSSVPTDTPAPAATNASPSQTCLSNGFCFELSPVQPYNPAQTAGGNGGIDIVDQYADTLDYIAKMLENDPNVDSSIQAMITMLASKGHLVADAERRILSMSGTETADFSESGEFSTAYYEVWNYLRVNPGVLSPELKQAVQTASNNINEQTSDFAGFNDTPTYNRETINKKFIDGADYVDGESNKVCNSGGDTSQCVR